MEQQALEGPGPQGRIRLPVTESRYKSMQSSIRLLDRAGVFVKWITEAEAEGYIRRHEGVARGKHKTRVVKLLGDSPIANHHGPMRKRGSGESHRRDTYDNPRGVWHIDRVPNAARGVFLQVVTDCLPKAA